MYTFPQLLLRNVALALIFIVSISVISITMLSSLLGTKSQEHISLINSLTQHFTVNDEDDELKTANNLLSTLKKISNYKQLAIYSTTGKQLGQFTNKDAIVNIPFIFPEPTKVNAPNLQLTIEYQLNFKGESILVLTFIILSIVLSLVLVFIAATLSSKRHKAVFNIIGQQIKNDLALIKNPNKTNNDKSTADHDVLEIPELKQGVDDIKA